MIRPPTPRNEAARLAALHSYNVLDTLPEESYDSITLLAAQICDAPIAAISLVDHGRQWFKAKTGLAASQTARDIAFCAHAILDPQHVLVVEDAKLDARFVDNPLVSAEPFVRFYAGSPLVTPEGLPVGTLCVIDHVPRTLSPRQLEALAVLGRTVVAQLELRKNVRRLEQTVVELEHAQVEIERSRAQERVLKDRFLSHVSHELRSPLNGIYGFVTILLDGIAGPLNEEQTRCLDAALRNTLQLRRMIGDLLELTRSNTGKLRVEPRVMQIDDCIEEVVRTASLGAAEKELALTASVDAELPHAVADASRLRQVLINLVENAINHTPNKGKIAVRAELDPKSSRRLLVSVTDTGSGIAPSDQARVFENLYQVSTESDVGRKGLGIGLAICEQIVRLMGGEIWVESQPGSGSRFSFTVPVLCIAEEISSRIADDDLQHAALISVTLAPSDGGSLREIHDAPLSVAWESVRACVDPTRDILLPRVARSGSSETFLAVVFADQAGARVVERRIEQMLARKGEGAALFQATIEVSRPEAQRTAGRSPESAARALAVWVEGRLTKLFP